MDMESLSYVGMILFSMEKIAYLLHFFQRLSSFSLIRKYQNFRFFNRYRILKIPYFGAIMKEIQKQVAFFILIMKLNSMIERKHLYI